MDRNLSPTERVEKLWRSLFLVRIWKNYILNHPIYTLKDNFISNYFFICMELNAHAMVKILLYLKENKLTEFFIPHLMCSQPCEEFYRKLRSLTSTNSTVVNFSMKEVLGRIARIQLLSEISNDYEPHFAFPKPLKPSHVPGKPFPECQFPDESQIIEIIQKCKKESIEKAVKLGLIKSNQKSQGNICVCSVQPWQKQVRKENNTLNDSHFTDRLSDIEERIFDIEIKLLSTTLKNYAAKFANNAVPERSAYVEVFGGDRRLIFRKTSVCWLFGKDKQKCSSDRRFRVMSRNKSKNKKAKKVAVKTFKPYKNFMQKKQRKTRK